jgi:hypothetical protein
VHRFDGSVEAAVPCGRATLENILAVHQEAARKLP